MLTTGSSRAHRLAASATAVALALASLIAVGNPTPSLAGTPAALESRSASLTATKATYTNSKHRSTNYSKQAIVRVSKAQYAGYLAFPTIALQSDESIAGGVISLYITKAKKAKKGGIIATPVAPGWSAAAITKRKAPKVTSGRLNKAIKAVTGKTVRIKLSASNAARLAASGNAVRLTYSRAHATVLVAKSGNRAPRLVLTITKATSPAFSIAVMPDTQVETLQAANPKFSNRTQWLVDNRTKLNLKYVLHTGDVVNWGWLAPSQFGVATSAMKKLSDAGLPYALSAGNHDTAAVGWNGVQGSTVYGGSAYMYNPQCPSRVGADQCRSSLLVRNTKAFNAAFPLSSIRNVGGVFEPGKVDNMWTSFDASGTKWLVLTLELWPRKDVLEWAGEVAAAHPKHNVIIQTHSYLNGSGGIEQSNGGYGATSGQYLFDNLIAKYPNIKLVFSGHIGIAAKRVDTGVSGNTVVSYLQTFHSPTSNPVRIVTVDPGSGIVTTKVVAPYTNETWTQYSTSDKIAVIR